VNGSGSRGARGKLPKVVAIGNPASWTADNCTGKTTGAEDAADAGGAAGGETAAPQPAARATTASATTGCTSLSHKTP
jgi:hypothetical protein